MTNQIKANFFPSQQHRQMMTAMLMDPGPIPTPVSPQGQQSPVGVGSVMNGMNMMAQSSPQPVPPSQIPPQGMGITSPNGAMQGLSPTGISTSNPNMGAFPPTMSQAALRNGLTLSPQNPYAVGQING